MKYRLVADEKMQPTLAEMTKKAIEVLQKQQNGFFLFVEGGLIDAAHHKVLARIALDETAELSKAVQQAVDMTSEDDTLIVVTADHSHTMTMSGYPVRGNDILGMTGQMGSDKLPFPTLSYANGPKITPLPDDDNKSKCIREDSSEVDMSKYFVINNPLRFYFDLCVNETVQETRFERRKRLYFSDSLIYRRPRIITNSYFYYRRRVAYILIRKIIGIIRRKEMYEK